MDVKIFFLPGKENIVSYFISRNISEDKAWNAIDVGTVDLELTNYNVGKLFEEELNDIKIRSVINYLENKDCAGEITKCCKKHLSKLIIVNGLLCYTQHGHILVVAPKSLRDKILEEGHYQLYSGHFGTFKAHQRILESAWWPDMFADVHNKIRDCKICIMVNGQRKSPH